MQNYVALEEVEIGRRISDAIKASVGYKDSELHIDKLDFELFENGEFTTNLSLSHTSEMNKKIAKLKKKAEKLEAYIIKEKGISDPCEFINIRESLGLIASGRECKLTGKITGYDTTKVILGGIIW